jgi:hypothetical protein
MQPLLLYSTPVSISSPLIRFFIRTASDTTRLR